MGEEGKEPRGSRDLSCNMLKIVAKRALVRGGRNTLFSFYFSFFGPFLKNIVDTSKDLPLLAGYVSFFFHNCLDWLFLFVFI
jgi:hypothetical protein